MNGAIVLHKREIGPHIQFHKLNWKCLKHMKVILRLYSAMHDLNGQNSIWYHHATDHNSTSFGLTFSICLPNVFFISFQNIYQYVFNDNLCILPVIYITIQSNLFLVREYNVFPFNIILDPFTNSFNPDILSLLLRLNRCETLVYL